jgi:hypothetical protein
MGDTRPALEYLLACSNASLESFQFSRMSQAANLRRQVRALVDQWIEAEVDAILSRWLLEYRRTDPMPATSGLDCFPLKGASGQISFSFHGEREGFSAAGERKWCSMAASTEGADAGQSRLLRDRTSTIDECKEAHQEQPQKSRKPYSKPIARRRLAEFLGQGVDAMSTCSCAITQQELEFGLEEPFVVGGEIYETREGVGSHYAWRREQLDYKKPPGGQSARDNATLHPGIDGPFLLLTSSLDASAHALQE